MIDGEKSTLINFQRYRSTTLSYWFASIDQSTINTCDFVASIGWLQIVMWLSHLLVLTIYSMKKLKCVLLLFSTTSREKVILTWRRRIKPKKFHYYLTRSLTIMPFTDRLFLGSFFKSCTRLMSSLTTSSFSADPSFKWIPGTASEVWKGKSRKERFSWWKKNFLSVSFYV